MGAAPGWVREYLFRPDGKRPYVVLDGASVPDLRTRLWEFEPESVCLYRGELEDDLAEVAPYLVALVDGSPFTSWLLETGWGEHWGTFVRGDADIDKVRNQFRRLMIVRAEGQGPLYFAFYDPRVLRIFLPTCDETQLEQMFGAAEEYLAEAEDPGQGHFFATSAGRLGASLMGLPSRKA